MKKVNNGPIPSTQKMLYMFGIAKLYFKLDLKTDIYHSCVIPNDTEYTALKSEYTDFEFWVIYVKLQSALKTFRALMNVIFRDTIDNLVVLYLDDIRSFRNFGEEHFQHVCNVLVRL